jgi:hypothetical protein
MAEEDKTELTPEEQQERVNAYIAAQVKAGLEEYKSQQQPSVPDIDEETQRKKQLKDLLNPIFSDDIAEARFQAADAKDSATFYRKHNLDDSEAKQIEETFDALRKAGKPLPREDILHHFRGKQYNSDPDKWYEKETERRNAARERAGRASDVGSSGIPREIDAAMSSLNGKTSEEIAEVMEKYGVTF